jgi:tRNA threonylcarbamoyl adenosine modification protein YeaZ
MKLFINTCLKKVGIAVVDGNGCLIEKMTWKADRQESKKLVPNISQIMDMSGIVKDDITEICLVIGPGSFTAVRIGFIVGRSFADGLGIDLKVCNTFEFLSLALGNSFKKAYLEAGGKGKDGRNLYEVDLSDGSFEIVGANNVTLNDKNVWNDSVNIEDGSVEECVYEIIGENWEQIVNGMNVLTPDERNVLEPFYVKEPNIT